MYSRRLYEKTIILGGRMNLTGNFPVLELMVVPHEQL